MTERTCASCGSQFTPNRVGRPRKDCQSCSPSHKAKPRVAIKCAGCEVWFTPLHARRRFCSEKCKWLANKSAACARCGGLVILGGKGSRPKGEATCRSCRSATKRPFDPSKCGTATGRDQHRRRNEEPCEPCRLAWNAISREHRRAAKERGWQRPDRPRLDAKCLGCGELVSGAYRKDRPYHRDCRKRVERGERKRAHAVDKLALAAAGTSSESAWVTGECAQCLSYFSRKGAPSPYCSKVCSRKARPNKRQFKISLRARLAIYERDGWICQLCLEPVDSDLMATAPLDNWAPSLDHIEPQAWALIPDHSPSNLRLAHRWCNSVRGDTTHYNDDDLRVA